MNQRKKTKIACFLLILAIILGILPGMENKVNANENDNQFSLGKFNFEEEKFINVSGSGNTKYRSLLIAYGNTLVDGESLILPTMDGFVKSDNASTNYSTVINMVDGKNPEEIANYVKEIQFKNSPSGQTIQVVISDAIINNKTFYYAGNQHYYQYVKYANIGTSSSNPGNHSWVAAYNEAKNLTYGGRQGYLATVTSFEEDLFIYNASSSIGWLGGTVLTHGDEEDTMYYSSFNKSSGQNTWYWACGPERGQVFFVGKGSGAYKSNDEAGYYFNWANGEPNKSKSGSESCLTSLRTGVGYAAKKAGSSVKSSWNDAPENSQSFHSTYGVKGYFVEYGDQLIGDSGSSDDDNIVTSVTILKPTVTQTENQELEYIGKENKPTITIKSGDDILVEGKDYDVEYVGVDSTIYGPSDTAPTTLGNYKAIIKYKEDYVGCASEVDFSIIVNEVVKPEIIFESNKIVYTGEELKPTIIIKDEKGNIIPEDEYEIKYENNIEIGKAKVIITNKENGNYVINTEALFEIIPIPGKTKVVDTDEANVVKARIDDSKTDLSEAIELTEADLKAIENGKNIEIYLEVNDISESISDEDKQLIEEKLGYSAVGTYLDISLFKKIEGEESIRITKTKEPITITFEIPENLLNTESNGKRTYKIYKLHDGVVTEIEVEVNGTIGTFQTDEFSTYALAYSDTLKVANPKTGDDIAIWMGLAIISFVGIVRMQRCLKKESSH